MLEKIEDRYALSWAEPQVAGADLRWIACWEVYERSPGPHDTPLHQGRARHWTGNREAAFEEARRLAAQAARGRFSTG